MTGGLEPSRYWQDVCALANDLLAESPMRDWSVVVSPQAQSRMPNWACRVDAAAKELAVTVPAEGGGAEDTEPEDVATYIVFDLLYERVCGDGGAEE